MASPQWTMDPPPNREIKSSHVQGFPRHMRNRSDISKQQHYVPKSKTALLEKRPTDTIERNNLLIQRGQLTTSVQALKGAEKAKAFKETKLAHTVSQLRQRDRNDINFQRMDQERNVRVSLNDLYSSASLPPLTEECITQNENQQTDLKQYDTYGTHRAIQLKSLQKNRHLAINQAMDCIYKNRNRQLSRPNCVEYIDLKTIRMDHFSNRKTKPKSFKAPESKKLIVTPSNSDSESDADEEVEKKIQKRMTQKQSIANIVQTTEAEDANGKIKEIIVEKRAPLINNNFFMGRLAPKKSMSPRKATVPPDNFEKAKTAAQHTFDKMVDYFDQKKIRDLASENQIKKKNLNYRVIRKELKAALFYISKLKLTPGELMTQNIFSSKPFQKKDSYELIQACKRGDDQKVKDLLKFNKYLVYDFDYIYMSGLHWACKRGHVEVVKILLNNGADIDFQDIIGRTALYFGIVSNNNELIQLLLDNQASPWSTQQVNYNQVCQEFNPGAYTLLSRARKLHMTLKMTPASQRMEIWKKLQIAQKYLL